MIANDRAHVSREIDVGDQLESSLWMPLHDRPLLIGEVSGFVQDFRRHDDLADVMQKCAEAEPEERARVHPGAVGKNAREKCDALTVTLGVVILALDEIAPVVRHLQEPSLQGRVASLDLCRSEEHTSELQ